MGIFLYSKYFKTIMAVQTNNGKYPIDSHQASWKQCDYICLEEYTKPCTASKICRLYANYNQTDHRTLRNWMLICLDLTYKLQIVVAAPVHTHIIALFPTAMGESIGYLSLHYHYRLKIFEMEKNTHIFPLLRRGNSQRNKNGLEVQFRTNSCNTASF